MVEHGWENIDSAVSKAKLNRFWDKTCADIFDTLHFVVWRFDTFQAADELLRSVEHNRPARLC